MDMMKDYEILLYQKKEISGYRDAVLQVKRRLLCHKQNLNRHWCGEEMSSMNEVLDELTRRLQRVSNQLEEIEREMLKVYERHTIQ